MPIRDFTLVSYARRPTSPLIKNGGLIGRRSSFLIACHCEQPMGARQSPALQTRLLVAEFILSSTEGLLAMTRDCNRYFPNTFFSRSVTWATGSFRIFFSSCPSMKNSPSSALLVT